MNTKKLWKEDLVVKINKKNKPILVKGSDFEKEFETIQLKNSKPYKEYYIHYL